MKEYTIYYSLRGEVKIKAESIEDATQRFYDRVGVSTDTIYESVTDDVVDYIEEE